MNDESLRGVGQLDWKDLLARWLTRTADRRAELAAALTAGRTIVETYRPGRSVRWTLAAPPVPGLTTPEAIARHLQGREASFGFTLEILPP